MNLITEYSEYKDVKIAINHYVRDNSLAIKLWNEEEGPIAMITTCLCDPTLNENEAYIDTNNCPWAMDFITQNNLGRDTDYSRSSGYCVYPLVEFNMDELNKYIG